MPVYRWANVDVQTDDELENDLPSIASSAAVDIDNLTRGKTAGLAGLRKLSSYLRALVESTSVPAPPSTTQLPSSPTMVSPAAMVVMHGAMVDSGWNHGINKVDDLIKTAAKVNDQFTALL